MQVDEYVSKDDVEGSAKRIARCERCSKTYRIANPDRAYTCRACGGAVRAPHDEDPVASSAEGRLICNDCQTLNPLEAEACVECEASLHDALEVEDAEEAADLLEQAKTAFRRGDRWSKGISWTYHLGALAYAIAALFAVVALRDTEVPLRGGVLVVALTTVTSIVMGTAALHLLFQPFAWTLTVALLATGVAITHAVGPDPLGIALLGSAAWALLAWLLLVPCKRASDLIAHHKDLYIEHHASQETRRSLRGRSPGERHGRLMRAMRRADRKAWKLSALGAVVLVALSTLGSTLVLRERPQAFPDALAAFESSWNGRTASALDPHFDARVREAESVRTAALVAGHGWAERLPALGRGTEERGEVEARVDYQVDGVPLSASFILKDLEWHLVRLELPYPDIEPTLAAFRDAWHEADPAALASFFSEDTRAERQAAFEETKIRRDWVTFPSIVDTRVHPGSEGRVNATFLLEKDDVQTRWFFREDGQWALFGLEMPTIRIIVDDAAEDREEG